MSLAQSLKALADENRMKILVMLLNSDLCVGALANCVDISKPAVSQHLRILRNAGLVRGEKRGYWTHYSVDRTALAQIAKELNALASRDIFPSITCQRIDSAPASKHNSKEVDMCQNCCQQPDKLMDKPENCSPQQIRECHGDVKEHPCDQGKRDPERE
jgi:DNA-binding transcriptional ArsR family regulator